MRMLVNEAGSLAASPIPDTLQALAPQPLLLPGESLKDYQLLRQAIFTEIEPRSAIEWLLAFDIAELSWEIQRYRLLRFKLLEKSRRRAIAFALGEIDLVGIPPDSHEEAQRQIELNALAWRSDEEAALQIEERLATSGMDQFALNAEVHIQTRDLYLMFEGLIISAQHRRTVLLREINNRRRGHRVPMVAFGL